MRRIVLRTGRALIATTSVIDTLADQPPAGRTVEVPDDAPKTTYRILRCIVWHTSENTAVTVWKLKLGFSTTRAARMIAPR